jgi:ABC-type antimicrobial peptide transport system permease subunit
MQARIVGIIRNINYASLNEPPQPAVYLIEFQAHAPFMTVHARVAGDPQAFAPIIESIIHRLNPDLPVFQVRTLRAQVDFATINERIAGTFVGTFGLLALVLAAVGIYGVIAYTTRQRTREIGIRMALGAQRSQILQLVLSQGMRLVYAGLGLGLALSVALTHFLTSLLFGITALDSFDLRQCGRVTGLGCACLLLYSGTPRHLGRSYGRLAITLSHQQSVLSGLTWSVCGSRSSTGALKQSKVISTVKRLRLLT